MSWSRDIGREKRRLAKLAKLCCYQQKAALWKQQPDVSLAGEAWDSLKYDSEGGLLSAVKAGLELGDLSLQDCF